MKFISILLTTLTFAASIPFHAQAAEDVSKASPAAASSASATSFAEGEIKKIDKGAEKITIKHGPLTSLNMPPMTMVFRVKDAAMLDQVKSGDKVKFIAEKINGALTVTTLQLNK